MFQRNIRSAAENDQYLEWDAETVRTVLTQQVLNIREVDLFKALLKYIEICILKIYAYEKVGNTPD